MRFKEIYQFGYENIFSQKPFLTQQEFSREAIACVTKLMHHEIKPNQFHYSQGSVIEVMEKNRGKKIIFLALLMTWYLNSRCWLVRFGMDSSDSLIPQILGALQKKQEPTVLMIMGISKLWDEAKLFELEVLLSFAYHHNFPIHMEFVAMEASQKNRPRLEDSAAKSLKFTERLKVAQAKKISGFLSPRQCSLISELSNGGDWLRT